MKLVVTGAYGFLGWHFRAICHPRPDLTVVPVGRAEFDDDEALRSALSGCDAVIHLAGENRGAEEQVWRSNVALAERLAAGLDEASARAHVVFANSTHIDGDTRYGDAKRRAARVLSDRAGRNEALFTDLVIPHAFGECGRPFYNSAVATFCHQLATGETPRIIEDRELHLVHARAVAETALAAIDARESGSRRLAGARIQVSEVLARLSRQAETYGRHIIPAFETSLDLDLFNAYRAALFPAAYPAHLPMRTDVRGELFEAVKTLHGGQCFISTTRPGITRGNHYHRRKIERFLVLKGEAVIRVRRLFHADVAEYRVSGARPGYVDMPALHTHDITNVGTDDLVTLFWAHEIFDPEHPDTYPEPV